MAKKKDPAILFYFRDFLFSVDTMLDVEIGQYIKILCHLADKGHLSEDKIKRICSKRKIPDAIMEHLNIDEDGLFYHPKMDEALENRRRHLKKQAENAAKRWEK